MAEYAKSFSEQPIIVPATAWLDCPADHCDRVCRYGCELAPTRPSVLDQIIRAHQPVHPGGVATGPRDCTCPMDRNDPHCPRHASCGRHVWSTQPIFSQIAWEMDLNWASDQVSRLFWQHKRLDMWEFYGDGPQFVPGERDRRPSWIIFQQIRFAPSMGSWAALQEYGGHHT